MDGDKKIPIFGREREEYDARLNAFKPVYLAGHSPTEELSWVLYDRDDPRHQNIRSDIRSDDELPRGAVVLTVDLSALSPREAKLLRENAREGEALYIPPQSHAVYLTAHEHVLKPIARGLTRHFDKRSHANDPMTPKNQSYGVGALWDRNPDADSDDRYHLRVSGNNQPESPVSGLRRVCISGSLNALLSRMALEMPTNIPNYHAFDDKPMFGDKTKLLSVYVADQLGQEVSQRVMRSSGSMEEGASKRFGWSHDPEQNPLRDKMQRIDAEAQRIREKHELNMAGSKRGVSPAGSFGDRQVRQEEVPGSGRKF